MSIILEKKFICEIFVDQNEYHIILISLFYFIFFYLYNCWKVIFLRYDWIVRYSNNQFIKINRKFLVYSSFELIRIFFKASFFHDIYERFESYLLVICLIPSLVTPTRTVRLCVSVTTYELMFRSLKTGRTFPKFASVVVQGPWLMPLGRTVTNGCVIGFHELSIRVFFNSMHPFDFSIDKRRYTCVTSVYRAL